MRATSDILSVVAKYALIAILLFLGASFLYAGMGTNLPMIELPGVTAYGVMVGIMFILFALIVARFWKDRPPRDARM
jgi:predicted tellurium resistance membrane protein TerC